MSLIEQITHCVIRGHIDAKAKYPKDMRDQPGVKELVEQALAEGHGADEILKQGLIAGMEVTGKKFSDGEYFVPEMLMSAKAMKGGLELLRAQLAEGASMTIGTVILGTVEGDMHDIGKNLVGMMLEGAGFEVIDLGTNTAPTVFVEKARENPDALIGLSALLTVTMEKMKTTIDALREAGLENKVMVGGAPVTQAFATEIGADGYAPDASGAPSLAKQLAGIAV